MTTNIATRPSFGRANAERIFTNLHVFLYRLSGGAVGGRMGTSPVLLLTTIGRKTGKRRTTPVLYLADGSRFVLAASNGGSAWNPMWWLNLQKNPEATIEVGRRKIQVRATTTSGEERQQLWTRLVQMFGNYAQYQKRVEREIPVVILEPLEAGV